MEGVALTGAGPPPRAASSAASLSQSTWAVSLCLADLTFGECDVIGGATSQSTRLVRERNSREVLVLNPFQRVQRLRGSMRMPPAQLETMAGQRTNGRPVDGRASKQVESTSRSGAVAKGDATQVKGG
jgi:hypothetical protein